MLNSLLPQKSNGELLENNKVYGLASEIVVAPEELNPAVELLLGNTNPQIEEIMTHASNLARDYFEIAKATGLFEPLVDFWQVENKLIKNKIEKEKQK